METVSTAVRQSQSDGGKLSVRTRRAYRRAQGALAAAHPVEFQHLYRAACAAEGVPFDALVAEVG